jgi:hypothetical protein
LLASRDKARKVAAFMRQRSADETFECVCFDNPNWHDAKSWLRGAVASWAPIAAR